MFKFTWIGLICLAIISTGCNSDDARAWQSVMDAPSIAAIDSFLGKYPDSGYKDAALQKKEEFIWQIACGDNTEFGYRKYQKDYPQGKFADQVQAKLDSIPTDAIDLADLTAKTFVGTINYGNREVQVLSLRFVRIEEDAAAVRFEATINTTDIRKNMLGTIDKTKLNVVFQENSQDQMLLNLSNGRAYRREGKIWLESTDPAQYWRLR